MERELKVGTKFKQIKVIEEYGFDYVGEEFEITSNNGTVVVGKCYNKGVGFGIEVDKFNTYFELIEEKKKEKDINFNTGDIIRITNDIFKNVEGQIVSKSISNFKESTISIINNNDKYKNTITVNLSDVEIVKPLKKIIIKEKFNREIEGYECEIKIRGLRTTLKILDEISDEVFTGSVYCYKDDHYDREEGIKRAFKKALIKQLEKEVIK